MFDVDNTDSGDPKKWTTPEVVKDAFPDVMYTDVSEYSKHKGKVSQYFTAFDPQEKDATRVFFGVEQPMVDYFPGTRRLSEVMETVTIPTRVKIG